MFRKIKNQEYGAKAAFQLYTLKLNDLAMEFHKKWPSGEIQIRQGIQFYVNSDYDQAFKLFDEIEDQKCILDTAKYLLDKNDFEHAIPYFKKYNGDIDSSLALKIAVEFHKREMFEDANFYYKLANNYQANTILSKCFRINTVGAYKTPKTLQQVFFSLRTKKKDMLMNNNSTSLLPIIITNQNNQNNNNNNNSSSDLSDFEQLDSEQQRHKQITKKKSQQLKKMGSYYSNASETFDILSLIYSFIPLILSLVRLIQSCSITVSESSVKYVNDFINFFEWSTKLFNMIAFDWLKFDEIESYQSLLILTFLFTFLLSMLSISLNNGYRSLLACFVNSIFFIPIGIGLDYLPAKLGISLFVSFSLIYIILIIIILKYVKNTIIRYLFCNYLGEKIVESKIKSFEISKHFGWFSSKNYVTKNIYANINLSLLIPMIIFILISYGILKDNPLFYLIIGICILIYFICIILQIIYKRRIYIFMQIIGNFIAYFSMIVGQLMLIPFMEMLTENDTKNPKTIIIFVIVFSIIVPFINIILSCLHVYKMKKQQTQLFVRIWLMNSYSSASSLCDDLKLSTIFWPVFDYAYHILYAISNAFVGPIMNIVLSSLSFILTLIIRPYYLISQNILYISEPFVILLLNIFIVIYNEHQLIQMSIGYVIIAVALIPTLFSLLFNWLFERRKEREFYYMISEINYPNNHFCVCCLPNETNFVEKPLTTEEINHKIFYQKKRKLYHELYRNEQNYAENIMTNTHNPNCIQETDFINKKVDPITLEYGNIINKIVLGPGMIFTASVICYLCRFT